jgi:predicted DNA-binding protein (MmcQ/YjbR family)
VFLDEIRNYCLSLKGTEERFPFDDVTLVFTIGNKIFALTDTEVFKNINLKCDPEKAIELRETYQAVKPGYHMNKKHWNTIDLNSDIQKADLLALISHSYDLVFNSLSKKLQHEITTG